MTVDAAGSDVVGDEARLYGDGNDNDRREQWRATNVLSGAVQGHVVQTGVVQGDVHVHSAATPATIAPRQLPPSPLKFVGRNDELASLDEWLDSTRGRSVLVALGGSGGVGKTALGVSWLRQHAARFTDGELYIDLGGSDSSEPMAPSEALGRLLRALGISSEQLPVGLDERAALYRSVTAGKALALLLDNVVSAAQVRLLLPSSESAVVVVTSRVRLVGLALEGAQFLDLNPLSTGDAIGLLSALLGRDRVDEELPSAWTLGRLCSGFPLALAVVSARLLAHPQWTLARIVAELQDQRRRLAALSLEGDISVQAVLDACCRDLSARASQLYRLLAWCPGDDFPVELVTCVLPDPADSKEALSELVEANLLQEQIRDRYCYHDLLRVHARQTDAESDGYEVRNQVQRRAIEWYLARAIEADLTVNPLRWRLGPRYPTAEAGFETAEAALDWYDQERANLLAAVIEAYEHGWDDLTWQLCEALWSFFLYRKHYPDWISTNRIGIAAAERCGHRLAESRLRCQLGVGYLDLQEFDMATDVCGPALALAEAEGHLDSVSTALSQLAKAARGRGELDIALDYLQRSLALVEEAGNRRGVALRLRRIGNILVDMARFPEAITHMRRSAAILEELGDRRGHARVLTFLGQAYLRAGRIENAADALNQALEIMRVSGSPTYQADILCELALLAEQRGQVTTALRYLYEAEAYYHDSGHPRWEELSTRITNLENGKRGGAAD